MEQQKTREKNWIRLANKEEREGIRTISKESFRTNQWDYHRENRRLFFQTSMSPVFLIRLNALEREWWELITACLMGAALKLRQNIVNFKDKGT